MGLSSNMIDQEVIRSFSSLSLKWWWCWGQIYKNEPNLNLDNTPLLTCWPFSNVCLSGVKHGSFMSITLTSIYLHHWKSFMKFGAKKSHEMISYNLSWIVSPSEWEHGMSTKPCYLAQMTLIELYNKSQEGSCWANVKKMPQSVENSNLGFIRMLLWPK